MACLEPFSWARLPQQIRGGPNLRKPRARPTRPEAQAPEGPKARPHLWETGPYYTADRRVTFASLPRNVSARETHHAPRGPAAFRARGNRNSTANEGGPWDPPARVPHRVDDGWAASWVVELRGRAERKETISHRSSYPLPSIPTHTPSLSLSLRLASSSPAPRLPVLTLAPAKGPSRRGETTAAADPSRVPDCLRRGPCRWSCGRAWTISRAPAG